jgi:hypothetical protein
VQALYLGRGTPFADRRDERRFGYNPVDRARAEWDPARFHAAAGLAEPWVTWPRCPIFRRDAGAKRLDHDPAFGTLWYRDLDRDEPIVMVEVVNHSAEPDGSFKRYLLRVDARCGRSGPMEPSASRSY